VKREAAELAISAHHLEIPGMLTARTRVCHVEFNAIRAHGKREWKWPSRTKDDRCFGSQASRKNILLGQQGYRRSRVAPQRIFDAPRSADNGDINPLMIFLRSSWTFARETIPACSN
jgi:hypothetical protein